MGLSRPGVSNQKSWRARVLHSKRRVHSKRAHVRACVQARVRWPEHPHGRAAARVSGLREPSEVCVPLSRGTRAAEHCWRSAVS